MVIPHLKRKVVAAQGSSELCDRLQTQSCDLRISEEKLQTRTRGCAIMMWNNLKMLSLRLLLLCCCFQKAAAKVISGDFRLSGLNSHYVLTSFAVVPEGARLTVDLTSTDMYENERYLKMRLYRDVEWGSFRKAMTCDAKTRFSKQGHSITFDFIDQKWRSEQKKAYVFNNGEDRPHYWYVVIDDCSLEQYMQDGKIPTIHYEISFLNHMSHIDHVGDNLEVPLSHLSADELPLTRVHSVTLVLSSLVAAFLLMSVMSKMFGKQRQVHIALLVVALAAGLDALSSIMEILHMNLYDRNGVGSYTLDALSAHFEALCDGLVTVLFLAIASGWTLPSNVMTVNPSQSAVQSLITDMSKPLSGGHRGRALTIGILLTHVILAQWGRVYDDDFESYHDLEHLPGRILLFMRVLLGILCLAATLQTQWKTQSPSLRQFYKRWALLSSAWFHSIPVINIVCAVAVPYYQRHPVMVRSTALAQSFALGLLAWLVTSQSSQYHQVSRLNTSSGNTADSSLTDSLNGGTLGSSSSEAGNGVSATAPKKTWLLGKTKVRLD